MALTADERYYCELARDYGNTTEPEVAISIDDEMLRMERESLEVASLALRYTDDELSALLEQKED